MPSDDNEFADESWVPEEKLAFLSTEADLHPEETSEERAKRLLTENVDVAAAAVIHIARNDQNPRLRLDAGKYIMERVLGKAGETPATGTLDELFRQLDRLKETEAAMAQSGPHSLAAEDES